MSLERTTETHTPPYRRWIEGSGLSLEANTPGVPEPGVYYVIREGVVCFSSEDLAEARQVFDDLGLAYWEALLASPDPQQRLDGARGLFHHSRTHARAIEILSADGTDQDRHRIAQARQRARYEERRSQGDGNRQGDKVTATDQVTR